ncbi:hypothetical protein [uncultured Roseobacter sp.]|uniref:hypothetical protein n=1 Tax=uncultured Roseobacter sp. TaxID=114847 RepID=UPI0026320C52|nr:hypothetical protein [uncultured Roseobacter sp.]
MMPGRFTAALLLSLVSFSANAQGVGGPGAGTGGFTSGGMGSGIAGFDGSASSGVFGNIPISPGSPTTPSGLVESLVETESVLDLSWLTEIDTSDLPDFSDFRSDKKLNVVSTFSEEDLKFGSVDLEIFSTQYDLDAFCDNPVIDPGAARLLGIDSTVPPVIITTSWWIEYLQNTSHSPCKPMMWVTGEPRLKIVAFPIAFDGLVPVAGEDLLPDWISLLHLAIASTGLLPDEVQFGPYYGEPECRVWQSQPTGAAYYAALESAECFSGFRDGKRLIGTEFPVVLTPRDTHDQDSNQDFSSAELKFLESDYGHTELGNLDNLLENWSDLDYGIRGSTLSVGVFDTRRDSTETSRARDPRNTDENSVNRPFAICELMASALNTDSYYTRRIWDSCFWSPRAMFSLENSNGWTNHDYYNEKYEESLEEALVWASLKDLFFSEKFNSKVLESGRTIVPTLSDNDESNDHRKDVAYKLLGEGLVFTETIWLIAHIDMESPEAWNLISKYVSEASFSENDSYGGDLLPIWAARKSMEN